MPSIGPLHFLFTARVHLVTLPAVADEATPRSSPAARAGNYGPRPRVRVCTCGRRLASKHDLEPRIWSTRLREELKAAEADDLRASGCHSRPPGDDRRPRCAPAAVAQARGEVRRRVRPTWSQIAAIAAPPREAADRRRRVEHFEISRLQRALLARGYLVAAEADSSRLPTAHTPPAPDRSPDSPHRTPPDPSPPPRRSRTTLDDRPAASPARPEATKTPAHDGFHMKFCGMQESSRRPRTEQLYATASRRRELPATRPTRRS